MRVRDGAELAAPDSAASVAVGAGSAHPPLLVIEPKLHAGPRAVRARRAGLEGITFDSGGLSLKPNDGMRQMKSDMAGAAGDRRACRPCCVSGSAPASPAGSARRKHAVRTATRPGDIITTFGGRTVEVLNTYAEGRLVLADLLQTLPPLSPPAG